MQKLFKRLRILIVVELFFKLTRHCTLKIFWWVLQGAQTFGSCLEKSAYGVLAITWDDDLFYLISLCFYISPDFGFCFVQMFCGDVTKQQEDIDKVISRCYPSKTRWVSFLLKSNHHLFVLTLGVMVVLINCGQRHFVKEKKKKKKKKACCQNSEFCLPAPD